jgi:hypothetical protein
VWFLHLRLSGEPAHGPVGKEGQEGTGKEEELSDTKNQIINKCQIPYKRFDYWHFKL